MKAADELDRMLRGEPVEASEDVRELAELAALLQGAFQEGPTPASTSRVRTAALSAFQDAPATPSVPSIVRSRPSGGRRLVARMALVAALVAGLPTAAWAASEDALPGQMLYPVKRGFEEFRLVLAGDAASEAEVLLGIAEERLGEAVRGLALGLGTVMDQALSGYDDAVLRFQVRIVQAQAEGLSVEALLEEAAGLAVAHEELFEEETVPTVVPPEMPAAQPNEEAKGDNGKGKAKGKGGGKGNGNAKGHRGSGGNAGGSGGGGGSSDSSGGGGNAGGGSGGGGGNAGGGVGEGKEEEPPAPEQDEDDDDGQGSGSGSGSGEGEGLGHEKAKGKGHDKHGDD